MRSYDSALKEAQAATRKAIQDLPPGAPTDILGPSAAHLAGLHQALDIIRAHPDAVLEGRAIPGY